jgi:putative oligomerization/nucleic acid binding protein
MKYLSILLLVIGSLTIQAQTTSSYTSRALASSNSTYTAKANGHTYTVGDTLWLANGSGHNGMFVYFKMGGFYQAMNAMSSNPNYSRDGDKLSTELAGTWMIIKKMKMQRFGKRGNKKMTFVLGGGNITNYWCYIEQAIQSCEVEKSSCDDDQSTTVIQAKQDSPLDELKKLVELLNLGAITQEEFDREKKELLEKN